MGGYTRTSTATATRTTRNRTPPGMPSKLPSKDGNLANYTTAIVSSIPIRNSAGDTMPNQYLLQHYDGSTFTKTLAKMDKIADSPINKTRSAPTPSLPLINSLPSWLQHGCKVTYNSGSEYHKGFIMISGDGTARFSCQRRSPPEPNRGG